MISPLLQSLLAPLEPYLNRPEIIEYSVNNPGELYLETAHGYHLEAAPALDYAYWCALCHALAHHQGLPFDPLTHPRLSVMIPGGHRLEALLGPTVASSLSVSLRLRRSQTRSLEAFGLVGALQERVIALLQKGAPLLISGGTSSGKTSLLNTLLQQVPLTQRVLVIEDTRELWVPHPNHQYYTLNRNPIAAAGGGGLTYGELLDHVLRSRPDLIVMGELSVANAYPLLRLLNTGHGGFMSTLHANSPTLALTEAIPQTLTLGGHTPSGVKDFLYATVALVLQLHKTATGARRLTHLFFPPSHELIHL